MITANGRRACAASNAAGSVNVSDTAPSRVAFTPNGLSSYVSDNGANTVSVITTPQAVSPNQGPTGGGAGGSAIALSSPTPGLPSPRLP